MFHNCPGWWLAFLRGAGEERRALKIWLDEKLLIPSKTAKG
jgi:hypothetical protein